MREDRDSVDLLNFIEKKGNRIEKSIHIPSPEGRNMAGWTLMQNLKVQPEVVTMLERLREHPMFKGQWKTMAQVAWSMIYLGLRNVHEFLAMDREDFRDFKSAFSAMEIANQVHAADQRQKKLQAATEIFKTLINRNMNKGTAFGRYAAWRVLERAMEARGAVEDLKTFDLSMRTSISSEQTPLMVDSEASDMWIKLFPIVGGDLDQTKYEEIYLGLTQEYYDELEAVRKAQEGHTSEPS